MFTLPAISLNFIFSDPIPSNLIKLPRIPLLQILVSFTRDYRSLVPDLAKPERWIAFKRFIAERTEALKMIDHCNHLYENDEFPVRTLFHLSTLQDFRKVISELAGVSGHAGLAEQKVSEVDPEKMRQFGSIFMEVLWDICNAIDSDETYEESKARGERYWTKVHHRRPLEARLRVERDCQIYVSFLFNILHNAIGTMACGESVNSLVQRALAGDINADQAMCKAIRIDDRLRQHPVFEKRYLRATRDGDAYFLRKYNDTSTPFTDKIRFPGLYFLLALADGLGILPSLTNEQLLNLADHAELHKYENRIEDAGYMGKRRNEYLKRKYQRMSMQ